MPFLQNSNDDGPRRRRTVRLEDITSKGQWDRTFYPKKNTLMSKASDLEICSGALVAVIIWAPTGEQFYYASRQVVKKNLIKSNLILPEAILEYQESLHMQPSSLSKPVSKLAESWNKITPKKAKKSLLYDPDQVEGDEEDEKGNPDNKSLKSDKEMEATKMFNAHYSNRKSKPSTSDDVILVSAPTAPRPPIACQSSSESSTEESSSSEESSSEESSEEESSSEEDIEQEKARLKAEINMLRERLPKNVQMANKPNSKSATLQHPANSSTNQHPANSSTNQHPANSSKGVVTPSKGVKVQKANKKQKILRPVLQEKLKKLLKSKDSQKKPSRTPDAPSRTPATSSRTPATSSRTPAAPSRTPAAPSRTPAAPSRTPATPSRTPAAPSRTPATPSRTPAAPSRTPAAPSRTPATPSRTPATPSRTPDAPSRTPATPSRTPATPSRTLRSTEEPKEMSKKPPVVMEVKIKEEPVDLRDDVIIKSEPLSPPRRSPPRRSPSVVHLRLNSPTPSEMGASSKRASKRGSVEVSSTGKRPRIEISKKSAKMLKDRISGAFHRDYQMLSRDMKQLVDSLWQKISPTRHPLKIFIYRFKFLFIDDPYLAELINTNSDSNRLYQLLKEVLTPSDLIDFEMFHHQISVITRHEIVKRTRSRSSQLKAKVKDKDEDIKQFTRDFFHFCFSNQMYLSNRQLLDYLLCNMSIEHITRVHKRIVCVPLQCLIYECGCFKSLLTSLQSRFRDDYQIADYFRQINLNSSCYSVMFAPFKGSKILCFVIRDSKWVAKLVKISQTGIHDQPTDFQGPDFSSYGSFTPAPPVTRRRETFTVNPDPWNRSSKKKKR